MGMNRARLAILAVSILALPLPMAQGKPPEENTPTMSERKQHALRGSVKSCTEESTHPGMTAADGKTYPEVHSEYTTEYDADGRILATRSRSSDGSQWVMRYSYEAPGRLLKTASGVEGKALTETTYSYDHQGRLQYISDGGRCDGPVSFRYDERGRKTKIEISCSADYRPNTAVAGSPFEVADRAPNLPEGEARPPPTTNMIGPRRSKCAMPAVI
jgi:YD repeat-containing protein